VNLFKKKMEDFSLKKGWNFTILNDDYAVLTCLVGANDRQFVVITEFSEIIEIYSPTFLEIKQQNDIPHQISTALLARNSTTRYGFWTINKIGEKYAFSYMHNCRLSGLTVDEFENIVNCCAIEVSNFENRVSDLTKTNLPPSTSIQLTSYTENAQNNSENPTQVFMKNFSTEAGKEAGKTIGGKVAKVALSAVLMSLGVQW